MTPRPIPGHPKYLVYEDGKVFSLKRKVFLKVKYSYRPYLRIKICDKGKTVMFWLHRLVADAFVAPVRGKEVNHVDRNTHNCHANNLMVMTMLQHKRWHKDIRNINSKYKSKESANTPF